MTNNLSTLEPAGVRRPFQSQPNGVNIPWNNNSETSHFSHKHTDSMNLSSASNSTSSVDENSFPVPDTSGDPPLAANSEIPPVEGKSKAGQQHSGLWTGWTGFRSRSNSVSSNLRKSIEEWSGITTPTNANQAEMLDDESTPPSSPGLHFRSSRSSQFRRHRANSENIAPFPVPKVPTVESDLSSLDKCVNLRRNSAEENRVISPNDVIRTVIIEGESEPGESEPLFSPGLHFRTIHSLPFRRRANSEHIKPLLLPKASTVGENLSALNNNTNTQINSSEENTKKSPLNRRRTVAVDNESGALTPTPGSGTNFHTMRNLPFRRRANSEHIRSHQRTSSSPIESTSLATSPALPKPGLVRKAFQRFPFSSWGSSTNLSSIQNEEDDRVITRLGNVDVNRSTGLTPPVAQQQGSFRHRAFSASAGANASPSNISNSSRQNYRENTFSNGENYNPSGVSEMGRRCCSDNSLSTYTTNGSAYKIGTTRPRDYSFNGYGYGDNVVDVDAPRPHNGRHRSVANVGQTSGSEFLNGPPVTHPSHHPMPSRTPFRREIKAMKKEGAMFGTSLCRLGGGVYVTNVYPETTAWKLGISIGDRIDCVNDMFIQDGSLSAAAVLLLLTTSSALHLTVCDQSIMYTLSIIPTRGIPLGLDIDLRGVIAPVPVGTAFHQAILAHGPLLEAAINDSRNTYAIFSVNGQNMTLADGADVVSKVKAQYDKRRKIEVVITPAMFIREAALCLYVQRLHALPPTLSAQNGSSNALDNLVSSDARHSNSSRRSNTQQKIPIHVAMAPTRARSNTVS